MKFIYINNEDELEISLDLTKLINEEDDSKKDD
jgi:hypothetical protein